MKLAKNQELIRPTKQRTKQESESASSEEENFELSDNDTMMMPLGFKRKESIVNSFFCYKHNNVMHLIIIFIFSLCRNRRLTRQQKRQN